MIFLIYIWPSLLIRACFQSRPFYLVTPERSVQPSVSPVITFLSSVIASILRAVVCCFQFLTTLPENTQLVPFPGILNLKFSKLKGCTVAKILICSSSGSVHSVTPLVPNSLVSWWSTQFKWLNLWGKGARLWKAGESAYVAPSFPLASFSIK